MEDVTSSMTLADLEKIRQDEAHHFSVVREALETLGADPTAMTPCANVCGVESQGLMQVIADPRTTVAQSLHAVLVAEMTDNAGWEMLVALAQEQGHDQLAAGFTMALNEERIHMQQVKTWFEEATLGKAISTGALVDDIADSSRPSTLH